MSHEHTSARDVSQDLQDEADFVVIGTGAAGATAAMVLSEAGHSVVMLEEGHWLTSKDFRAEMVPTFKNLLRDAGAQISEGRAFMPMVQGRCVGGSTVVNSAIIWRMPEDVHHEWARDHNLGDALPFDALHKNFDRLERDLSIRVTPDNAAGPSAMLMELGTKKIGLRGERIKRYDTGCKGSGRCLQGCPIDAKQSMAISYVPKAIDDGARLYAGCRAEDFVREGNAVRGVVGRFSGAGKHRLRVRARRGVIVAASTVQTPGLLRRAGVRSRTLGKHFQAHPGTPIMGRFPGEARVWGGATQGYDADHFREHGRFKLEHLNLAPELLLARLPGVGSVLRRYTSDLDQYGMWAVQARFHAQGTVGSRFGAPVVKYTPTPRDMDITRFGLRRIGEAMFEAGAEAIIPLVHGMPRELGSPDELNKLDDLPADPRAYSWLISHMFGAARMGHDPKTSVVDPNFQVHGRPGLYVVDSSIFPTNMGVNPQHTIMALSMLAAQKLAGA